MYYNKAYKKSKKKQKHKKSKSENWSVFFVEIVTLGLMYLTIKNIINYTIFIIGELIALAVVYIANKLFWKSRNEKYLHSGITEVDNLSGEDFERFLSVYFQKHGYHVKFTPKTHDYGADLILTKNNRKTVVQAKRYADKVGIKAIQEIVSAKVYYKADRMMVVTNSQFTHEAEKLAATCNVELWNRNRLVEEFKIEEVQCFKDSENYKDKEVCPYCEGKLILKKGVYGSFLGCSNYPKCRYTQKVKSKK